MNYEAKNSVSPPCCRNSTLTADLHRNDGYCATAHQFPLSTGPAGTLRPGRAWLGLVQSDRWLTTWPIPSRSDTKISRPVPYLPPLKLLILSPPTRNGHVGKIIGSRTMSKQSDQNNHANQLNENNDAYWQSRGYDERPADWDSRSEEDD